MFLVQVRSCITISLSWPRSAAAQRSNAVVSEVADEVVVMRDGRQMEAGSCASVFARPQSSYTRELLAAIPRVDGPLAANEEEYS